MSVCLVCGAAETPLPYRLPITDPAVVNELAGTVAADFACVGAAFGAPLGRQECQPHFVASFVASFVETADLRIMNHRILKLFETGR